MTSAFVPSQQLWLSSLILNHYMLDNSSMLSVFRPKKWAGNTTQVQQTVVLQHLVQQVLWCYSKCVFLLLKKIFRLSFTLKQRLRGSCYSMFVLLTEIISLAPRGLRSRGPVPPDAPWSAPLLLLCSTSRGQSCGHCRRRTRSWDVSLAFREEEENMKGHKHDYTFGTIPPHTHTKPQHKTHCVNILIWRLNKNVSTPVLYFL